MAKKKHILRDKDIRVLNLIVESYLKLGKPISSGSISQKAQVTVSPATVRNIMAKLDLSTRADLVRFAIDNGLLKLV